MQFQTGQRVVRREDRVTTGATVLEIDADPDTGDTMYRIAYDEGGAGWWPEGALSTANAG